jgi:WD40 repeat protein
VIGKSSLLTLVTTLRGHKAIIFKMAWSSTGEFLASPSKDHTIRIWDIRQRRELVTLIGHNHEVNCVSWFPDAQRLASGSDGGLTFLWDINNQKYEYLMNDHEGDINAVAVSPDGKILASGSDSGRIFLLDVETRKKIFSIDGHRHWVVGLAWSADGTMLASCSRDKLVCVWSRTTGKLIHRLEGHSFYVNSIAWGPQDKVLASTSHDKTVRFWNIDTGEEVYVNQIAKAEVNSVSFSADHRRYAFKSNDDFVYICDMRNHRLVNTIREPSSRYVWPSAVFHPICPKILATLGEEDMVIRLWKVSDEQTSDSINLIHGVLQTEKEYDVYIVHASEDKNGFVQQLVQSLREHGLKVWYDEEILRLGDPLRKSIDIGLRNSRFGVVVISPDFFKKAWAQRELDGLIALENDGRKRVLPIWHEIDERQVRCFSPTLADRLGINTSSGVNTVVRRILDAVGVEFKGKYKDKNTEDN